MTWKQTAVSMALRRPLAAPRNPSRLDELRLPQRPERLDHAGQLVLGRAVAAVGVRVAALQQLGVALADRRRVRRRVQIEIGQRVALQPPELLVVRGLLGLGPGLLLAEKAECVPKEAARRLGGRFARAAPGLERPGWPPAAGKVVLLPGADLGLAHAGEEIPAAVVLGGMRL